MRILILSAAVFALVSGGTASAGWEVDFGAEERLRAEGKNNLDFNSARDDNGGLVYGRFRLHGKAVSEKYELFAEGLDLRVANVRMPKAAQEDQLDLHQAYALFRGIRPGLPLELKIGRQELKYGKGRLLWASSWSNRINHLDAAVLKYRNGAVSADAFYGARVSYDDDGWNSPNKRDMMTGVYASYKDGEAAPLIEAYFLSNYDSSGPSALNRRTVGMRAAFQLPGGIDCDLEIPYQFGKTAGKDISAYAFHLDAAKAFEAPWNPRMTAAFNLASGDRKAGDGKSNTFVPLYQSTHDPYGLMDLFRWQNMREAALGAELSPSGKWNLIAGLNFFWLDNDHDSWYNSSGSRLRTDTTGQAGKYVGRELSLRAKYDPVRDLKLEGGYAHFFSGDYVENTGTDRDADWLYFQARLKI